MLIVMVFMEVEVVEDGEDLEGELVVMTIVLLIMVMIVVVVLDLGDIGAVMLERRWITSGCSWSVKKS